MGDKKLGIENQQFYPCSAKPNCVNSMASPSDKTHYIAPLIIEKNKTDKNNKDLLFKIISHLRSWPRTTLIRQTEDYLHFEVKSALFRFVDDLEIYWPKGSDYLHFKSSSRVGYSDLGANRKRVEQLKKELLLKL